MSFITLAKTAPRQSLAMEDLREDLPHLYVMLCSEPGFHDNHNAMRAAAHLHDALKIMGEDMGALVVRIRRLERMFADHN